MVEVPTAIPVTIPEVPTPAMPDDTLLHTPPPAASVRAVVEVVHKDSVPVMVPALSNALTVTTTVGITVPQPPEAV